MYVYCMHCDNLCGADHLDDLEMDDTYFLMFTCPYCGELCIYTLDYGSYYEA